MKTLLVKEPHSAINGSKYPPGISRLIRVISWAAIGTVTGLFLATSAIDGSCEESFQNGAVFHSRQHVEVFGVQVFDESSNAKPSRAEFAKWRAYISRLQTCFAITGMVIGTTIGSFWGRKNTTIMVALTGIVVVLLFAASKGRDGFFPVLFIAGVLLAVAWGAYAAGYRRGEKVRIATQSEIHGDRA